MTNPETDIEARGRMSRLTLAASGLLVTTLALNSCGLLHPHENKDQHSAYSEKAFTTEQLLIKTGDSLIASRDEYGGGWRFRSAIQAPHFQTDRDVGASSVGMGFLVMADKYPEDPKWLKAAEETADWLIDVSSTDDQNNIYWADYVDDKHKSPDAYTSFDDGTIGIGDYFWRLYERTNEEKYKQIALSTLRWTFNQAENIGQTEPIYRWQWNAQDEDSEYQMGMGTGVVGIVHSLATYYERLHDTDPQMAARCKQFITGTLLYMNQTRETLGKNSGDSRALPETGVMGADGDTNMNSGYLSGAAGAAFMYLRLYDVFGNKQYLAEANELFDWLEDDKTGPMVRVSQDAIAWKLAIDPQGDDNPALATGFEEGATGIGWTYLQAYKLTGEKKYLTNAQQAANWLKTAAVRDIGGMTWNEHESPRSKVMYHANLNNGNAGIGMFLHELYEVTDNKKYEELAQQALNWIENSSLKDRKDAIYWLDNDGEADYSNDPSWHWGKAGIIAFAADMSGGSLDMPGQQSALDKK